MSAQAYVNGDYLPLHLAEVPAEDRGLQFGDSIYEVIALLNQRPLDWERHIWRLGRNLAALQIMGAPGPGALQRIARTLVRRARLADGLLYIQVTRGAARRDHPFPAASRPTLVMTARPFDFRKRLVQQEKGVAVISIPDPRWKRCDIKTTNLLGAVLAKEDARRAGAFEAMFIGNDGMVTEGGSTNIWMVDEAGRLVTHPLSSAILGGIARETLIRLAEDAGITTIEHPFGLDEALAAPELFLTSTTAPVLPIIAVDGRSIGDGQPGPVVKKLCRLMWAEVERQTGWRP